MRTRLAAFAIFMFSTLTLSAAADDDDAALWQSLATPGHVAVMRHALAPGTGDPGEFELRDCNTQRNLSAEGRAQAERIGARFKASGITEAYVFDTIGW